MNVKKKYSCSARYERDHLLIKFFVIIIGVMSLVYVSVLSFMVVINFYTEFNFFYIQFLL